MQTPTILASRRYAWLTGAFAVLLTAAAAGQEDAWYPSFWGEDDQRGAANRLTPAKVLEASALITRGEVYSLGRIYDAGIPMFGTRHFSLRIPQAFGPMGRNEFLYLDEIVSGEIGQIGTQFDGLGHVGIGERFYNGNRLADIARPEGLVRLGVENVGPIVTRGVLIDVAAYKGVERLAGGYEITAEDLERALSRQGTPPIRPGDVVLLHTGWGSLWEEDGAAYLESSPGLGLEAAQWLVDREIVMVGADNWGIEVSPNPDSELAGPVHQLFVTRNGIYQFENLATDALARDGVHQFAFFFAPVPLKGATGSPGNPVAIR